ncbi:MAG: phosphate ABC transporter substrate-binding protein PstS [Gemmatimonadaceae bacterium]
MPSTRWCALVGLLCTSLLVQSCAPTDARRDDSSTAVGAARRMMELTGAGATFPYPLYSRWFNEYAQLAPLRINYQSIGSGAGIRQVVTGTVDFGASDVPMSDTELAAAGEPILHIPMIIGAVAITYNLPELTAPLRLSGTVLADIFLGRITRWNDARIAADNPGAPLPARDILVVHRADGGGTSFIFSEYLTAVSPEWARGPGRSRDVAWPVGIGSRGNEGVAGQVKQVIGTIGYLEVVYARQNHLPVVHVRNRAGRFISPMPFEIASAAIDAAADTSLRATLVDAAGLHAYPLASYTWMLVAPQRLGATRTRMLLEFVRWALTDGSDIASRMGYVPLPSSTAVRVLNQVDRLAASQTATQAPRR